MEESERLCIRERRQQICISESNRPFHAQSTDSVTRSGIKKARPIMDTYVEVLLQEALALQSKSACVEGELHGVKFL